MHQRQTLGSVWRRSAYERARGGSSALVAQQRARAVVAVAVAATAMATPRNRRASLSAALALGVARKLDSSLFVSRWLDSARNFKRCQRAQGHRGECVCVKLIEHAGDWLMRRPRRRRRRLQRMQRLRQQNSSSHTLLEPSQRSFRSMLASGQHTHTHTLMGGVCDANLSSKDHNREREREAPPQRAKVFQLLFDFVH